MSLRSWTYNPGFIECDECGAIAEYGDPVLATWDLLPPDWDTCSGCIADLGGHPAATTRPVGTA